MISALLDFCRRMCEQRIEAVKVRAVRMAASGLSHAAAFVLTMLLMAIGAIFLGVALTLLLAAWLGSFVWGFVITGLLFLIAAMVVWSSRSKFLHRSTVRGVLSVMERREL